MIRTLSIFLGTFLIGALLALGTRAALYSPHDDHDGHAPAAGGEYEAMVSNPLTPVDQPSAASPAAPAPAKPHPSAPAADAHAGHGSQAQTAPASQPVNSICAICGMDVDPSIPTAQYQGKTIGFGCRMCPPKFKANPDKYGPSYLRNEVHQP